MSSLRVLQRHRGVIPMLALSAPPPHPTARHSGPLCILQLGRGVIPLYLLHPLLCQL